MATLVEVRSTGRRRTGEVLPGAHFTEQESTVGYLRVLRDILREKGIPYTVYGDRHSSLKRNDNTGHSKKS